MTAPGEGWPANPAALVAWLRSLPAPERYRVAKMLVDRHITASAVGLEGAGAVYELTRAAGSTWDSVAEKLGTSRYNVNKMVHRYRMALAGGECLVCEGPGPTSDMCDACASSVVLDPPDGGPDLLPEGSEPIRPAGEVGSP